MAKPCRLAVSWWNNENDPTRTGTLPIIDPVDLQSKEHPPGTTS